jgi:signal transduction histidine kinase
MPEIQPEARATGTPLGQAEELRQRDRDLTYIYQVGQALTATLDLRQVLNRLMQAATEMTSAQAGSVWLWDKEHAGDLICRSAYHPDFDHLLVGQRLSLGQGIVGWVAQNGKAALVSGAQDDPRFYPGVDAQTGFRTLSLLTVPLRVRNTIIGVLQIINKLEGAFDQHDLFLVETLAGPAAIAIDNAQLVEALREFAATLQARNQELDAFAHTVAHDLKAPLTPLLGLVEDLQLNYATLSSQSIERHLQLIASSGHKMNNIIDELLLLAEVRKAEIQRRPLDMGGIVSQACQRLADMCEKQQVVITLPSAWPEALGHAPWVEQVWVNYLSNAIKYGGRPPHIELGAELQLDGQVRFWVQDNGPGLTPENQARLFVPFTRLDQTRAQGQGLGLSIVRRIVEKLGGSAGVQSDGIEGRGSCFYFTLPSAPPG